MNKIFQAFVKITAWPIQFICFRTKIHYEDKLIQSRKIKGPAIIVSNHTSVYDFAVMLFVFPFRFLRYLMAEILFKRKFLGWFLNMMGGIKVDRENYNFTFINKSLDILEKGGVVGIFPEGRLPVKGEKRPIPFKPSAAYLAFLSEVKIIPVYTNGSYFSKKRAHIIIGKTIDVKEIIDEKFSEKENIERINNILRERIIELQNELEIRISKGKKEKKEI